MQRGDRKDEFTSNGSANHYSRPTRANGGLRGRFVHLRRDRRGLSSYHLGWNILRFDETWRPHRRDERENRNEFSEEVKRREHRHMKSQTVGAVNCTYHLFNSLHIRAITHIPYGADWSLRSTSLSDSVYEVVLIGSIRICATVFSPEFSFKQLLRHRSGSRFSRA